MTSCWFFSLLLESRSCLALRQAWTWGALPWFLARNSSLCFERSAAAEMIELNSAAMTSWILRSGGSVCVRKLCAKRMACSWVVGSDGKRAWDANRLRRARRYFSAESLVYVQFGLSHWPCVLTPSKEDLETRLLSLDVFGAEFEKWRDELHSLH